MGAAASRDLIDRLRSALDLGPADVMVYAGPLALADLNSLVSRVGRADLRDEAFFPVLSPEFRESEDIFAAIAKGDILLHHPYESYEPVVELLEQAARDPAVLAIKQTLYRVSRDSPMLESLITAAENGKQVTALVELKARLSEEMNVEWARYLEQSGVQVVYGMIGLKTHCKVTLVVRRVPGGVRRYVHLGTGNYNEETARIYSDLSFFTARPDVCDDVSSLFNLLTGYSAPPIWQKLVVAPLRLRHHLLDLIEDKTRVAKKGKKAKIIIESNALIDPRIITALAEASQAGVDVTLCIRGPCGVRVGIPGVSDRLTVRMVIDRFLEHTRVFYFASEDQEDVYITSTDVMPRNFDRRVEVMLPIEDPRLKRRIVDEILAIELADNTKAAVLQENGSYKRLKPGNAKPVRAQAEFIKLARARAAAGDQSKRKKRKKDKKDKKKHENG
jgi:polyphosphate kinase